MRIAALLSFAAVACALRLPVEEALGAAPFAPAGHIDFDDSVLVRFHVFCWVQSSQSPVQIPIAPVAEAFLTTPPRCPYPLMQTAGQGEGVFRRSSVSVAGLEGSDLQNALYHVRVSTGAAQADAVMTSTPATCWAASGFASPLTLRLLSSGRLSSASIDIQCAEDVSIAGLPESLPAEHPVRLEFPAKAAEVVVPKTPAAGVKKPDIGALAWGGRMAEMLLAENCGCHPGYGVHLFWAFALALFARRLLVREGSRANTWRWAHSGS